MSPLVYNEQEQYPIGVTPVRIGHWGRKRNRSSGWGTVWTTQYLVVLPSGSRQIYRRRRDADGAIANWDAGAARWSES